MTGRSADRGDRSKSKPAGTELPPRIRGAWKATQETITPSDKTPHHPREERADDRIRHSLKRAIERLRKKKEETTTPSGEAPRYASERLAFVGSDSKEYSISPERGQTQTLREVVGMLDQARAESFEALRNREAWTSEESDELKMAPCTSDKVYLLPHSEPFFSEVHPVLLQLGEDKRSATIHVGLAGDRNLSILGATKADAAILFDINRDQRFVMEALLDDLKKLGDKRGVGNFGPTDLIHRFSQNRDAQAVLDRSRATMDPPLHIDLGQELTVPESWLYQNQKDGRFDHVARVACEGKIAGIAINIADTNGFEKLANVLENAKEQFPDLKDAKVGTVFLSNAMCWLAAQKPYHGSIETTHATSRSAIELAWENIQKLAPNNPYVIAAHASPRELLQEQKSPFFDRTIVIGGPTYEQLSAIPFENLGEPRHIVKFNSGSSERHHGDYHADMQVTVIGRLEDLKGPLSKPIPPRSSQ